MANLRAISSPVTINSADNYILGEGSGHEASTLTVQLTPTAFVATGIIPKARKARSTQAFVAIPYILRGTTDAATNAGTVITAASIIKIDATGLEISLDNSAGYTSGSMATDFEFTLGVAAR
jgi:hypothetical protein